MKTVTVNASVRYDVLIEKGLLSHCGEKTAEVFSPQKSAAAIITDDNVSALYLNTVVRSFEQAGFRRLSFHLFAWGGFQKPCGADECL